VRDSSTDKLVWKWSKGFATLPEFGRPEATAEYALCIYDSAGGDAALNDVLSIPAAGTCGGVPCWKPNARGFKYKGRGANADGVDTVILKEGPDGRAKLLLKAKGPVYVAPPPFDGTRRFAQDSAVRVQLVNSVGGCWESTYALPAGRNDPTAFKDKQ
jgi:hypothetical protein